jgi:hypothetical protein
VVNPQEPQGFIPWVNDITYTHIPERFTRGPQIPPKEPLHSSSPKQFWARGLLLSLTLPCLFWSPTTRIGIAKHYSPGIVERVYHTRIAQGLTSPGWKGALASSWNCSEIGSHEWASVNGRPFTEYLVVDCSRPGEDRARHIKEGLVIEVDYSSALKAGIVNDGRGPAIVVRWP